MNEVLSTKKTYSLESLKEVLMKYSEEHLVTLIPQAMLHLSDAEKNSIEFAFWFCHIVERDLGNVLTGAISWVNEKKGAIPSELSAWVLENYDLKMEKVDPSHPDFDFTKITFGDRIYFVEQLRGRTAHTKFLWKIKNLRDDLSHGRIDNLMYQEKSILDNEVKRQMLIDYITVMNDVENETEGGFIATLTEEQRIEIQKEFEDLMKNKDN